MDVPLVLRQSRRFRVLGKAIIRVLLGQCAEQCLPRLQACQQRFNRGPLIQQWLVVGDKGLNSLQAALQPLHGDKSAAEVLWYQSEDCGDAESAPTQQR